MDDDLYRELIIEHWRHPRHRGSLDSPDLRLEASNPLCGDELVLSLRLGGGRIEAVAFEGQGCSISQASASMMCEELNGLLVAEADGIVERFRAMLLDGATPDDLGDLEALQGVRQYPVRVKCAMLGWNALQQGLQGVER